MVGSTQQPIIKGITSTADQNAVVLLMHVDRTSQEIAGCTGTLLAPNLLLTARHCVSTVSDQGFACNADGTADGSGANVGADLALSGFYVFTGVDRPQFQNGNVTVAAQAKKIFHDDAKVLCSHDLSLILLDRDIPDAQIYPLRLDSPPVEGETITAIGWGVTTTTDSPAKRQQRTGIKILTVGPFDGSRTVAPLPPNDFEVGESICQGDSGGPALAESTNSVVGVVSRGGNGTSSATNASAGCTGTDTTNIYTKVEPFKDLILSAFAEAGHDPWIEGQPDPRLAKAGEDCSDDSGCRSNVCLASKCVDTCNADSDCSSGLVCKTEGANKVCEAAAAAAPATVTTTKTSCAVSAGIGANGDGSRSLGALFAGVLGVLIARRRRR